MSMIICRTCGLELSIPAGQDILCCPACGTNNGRPLAEGESLDKLRRATRLRLAKEYTEAELCYRHVLLDVDEHEALWGKLLCQYGVEFVCDSVTGKRLPVVHIPQVKPMQETSDFAQACALAPDEVRLQYEADAAYIDEALADIHTLADSCPPYDVFLCHKTSIAGGEGYTKDYVRAEELYTWLRGKGYRVFFAPKEAPAGITGANYEALIYHALHTAKVMLVICSDPAHLASTWVQSEWQRYLMRVDRREGRLAPLLYAGLAPSRLPREFLRRKLEALSMEALDAQQILLALVEKCCGMRHASPASAVPEAPAAACSPASHFLVTPMADGMQITGYAGDGGEVRIPPKLHGRTVVAIGDKAFRDCESLTAITIPEGVTHIGKEAFYGCSQLERVTLPNSLITIGDMAFFICSALADVALPDHLSSIGMLAFCGCSFAAIVLPESLSLLGLAAFCLCNSLTEIAIPAGVSEIQGNPFPGCASLQRITVAPGNAHFSMLGDVLTTHTNDLVCYPAGLPADVYTIPEGITSLADWAFYGCDHLTAVHIPDSVQLLGDGAFQACKSLQSVTIPDGVTDVSYELFNACASLRKVVIPPSVSVIHDSAFGECAALESLAIPRTVTDIGAQAFTDCPSLTLDVHAGSTAFHYARDNGMPYRLIIPPRPIVIPTAPAAHFGVAPTEGGVVITAYNGDAAAVSIPPVIGGRQVVAIGVDAFRDNERLTTINIPLGVTVIGESAFLGCINLGHVFFPASLTTIAASAFIGCASLAKLSLPDSLTEVGAMAFCFCCSLTEVHLPARLTSMGWNPFAGCICLERITVDPGNPAFRAHNGLLMTTRQELVCYPAGILNGHGVIPEGVTAIMPWACSSCAFTDVAIPDSVTLIDGGAFEQCTGLTTVAIPDSVTLIQQYAFQECASLTTVTIPESVTDILPDVFKDCPELTLQVVSGSCAHQYAQENGIPHQLIAPSVRTPAYAPESHFETSAEGNGVSIKRYHGPGGVVKIPPQIGGRPVLTLAGLSFVACQSVTEVVIPEGVKVIRDCTFAGCQNLTRVHIPASVETIPRNPFRDCFALQTITVAPENPVFYVRNGVLLTDSGTLVCCPPGVPGASFAIPQAASTIRACAFESCRNLTTVSIHQHVTSIEADAFSLCPHLSEFTVDARNSVYCSVDGVLMTRAGALVAYPIGRSASEYAIPAGVVRIGDSAFQGCTNLTRVVFPPSVTSIGMEAFQKCSRLRDVQMTPGLREIGVGAFQLCALTELTLPEGVTSLGNAAFSVCEHLTTARLPDSVTSLPYGLFKACSSLTSVTIPAGVVSLDAGVFADCQGFTLHVREGSAAHQFALERNIPFKLTSSAGTNSASAFAPESHFETGSAHGGVAVTKYVGPGGEVLIPPTIGGQNVVKIGDEAFEECDTLTSVTLPETVVEIGARAFNCCAALAKVSLPESLRRIGLSAFGCCSAMQAIRIPRRVTHIDEAAFIGCTALTEIAIPAAELGKSVFQECSALVSAQIAAGVTRIPEDAFQDCASLQRVQLPESVVRISAWAFNGCSALRELTFPVALGYIGGYAFGGCTSLTRLKIPEQTRFGTDPFGGLLDLTLLVTPNSLAHRHAIENHISFELTSDGSAAPAADSHFTFRFAPGNATCALEKYTGPGGDVVIPETYQGVPVAGIWKTAFDGVRGLRSILLPHNLRFIGENLFRDLPGVRIRVYRHSLAHTFAISHFLSVDVID